MCLIIEKVIYCSEILCKKMRFESQYNPVYSPVRIIDFLDFQPSGISVSRLVKKVAQQWPKTKGELIMEMHR